MPPSAKPKKHSNRKKKVENEKEIQGGMEVAVQAGRSVWHNRVKRALASKPRQEKEDKMKMLVCRPGDEKRISEVKKAINDSTGTSRKH